MTKQDSVKTFINQNYSEVYPDLIQLIKHSETPQEYQFLLKNYFEGLLQDFKWIPNINSVDDIDFIELTEYVINLLRRKV